MKRLPNNFGGVVKNYGNRYRPYQARITKGYDKETGKQIYETIGWYTNRESALNALVEYHKTPEQKKAEITFKQLYDEFAKKHFHKLTDGGATYKTAYKYCQELYDKPFAEITFGMLQDVVDNCGKDYSIKYLIRSLFNMMYKLAKKKEIVKEKLSKDLDIGKKVTKHKKTPFSDDEIQKLWENKDKIKGVDTVLILIYSCMRINEMLKKIENIDFDARFMINGSKTVART